MHWNHRTRCVQKFSEAVSSTTNASGDSLTSSSDSVTLYVTWRRGAHRGLAGGEL